MQRSHPVIIIVAVVILTGCSTTSVSQQVPMSTLMPLPTVAQTSRIAHPSPTLPLSPIPPTHVQPTTTPTIDSQIHEPVITHIIEPSISYLPNAGEGLAAVSFVDAQHGWLASGQALLATDDAGQSWRDVYDASNMITSIDFISLQRGWMVAGERMYATSDGGASWELVPSLNISDVRTVDFVDARHGWASAPVADGQEIVLRTIDGGANWKKEVDPCSMAQGFYSGTLSFTSPSTGWAMCGTDGAAGSQGKELFRTDDGGIHWKSIVRSDPNSNDSHKLNEGGYLTGSFFLDTTHGWYSERYANAGWLASTDDGGQTWRYPGLGGEGRIPTELQFITPALGYVLIEYHGRTIALVATSDGGGTWTQLYPSLAPTGEIFFFDRQQGIATGSPLDMGAILRTSDGGKTWIQITSIKADTIKQISFPDQQHGCIEAENDGRTKVEYLVYRTNDGGSSWNVSSNEQHCVASATPPATRWHIFREKLLSSADGGKTWTLYEIHSPLAPELVSSIDANYAWFKDAGDHLYTTSDGGQDWTQLN